jgi:hypothetical protein
LLKDTQALLAKVIQQLLDWWTLLIQPSKRTDSPGKSRQLPRPVMGFAESGLSGP